MLTALLTLWGSLVLRAWFCIMASSLASSRSSHDEVEYLWWRCSGTSTRARAGSSLLTLSLASRSGSGSGFTWCYTCYVALWKGWMLSPCAYSSWALYRLLSSAASSYRLDITRDLSCLLISFPRPPLELEDSHMNRRLWGLFRFAKFRKSLFVGLRLCYPPPLFLTSFSPSEPSKFGFITISTNSSNLKACSHSTARMNTTTAPIQLRNAVK